MRIDPSSYLKINYTKFYNKNVVNPIKICALGDIHISDKVSLKMTNNLYEQIKKENVDYICLLGDLIDLPEELEKEEKRNQLLDFLRNLGIIAPTMIALGNHDYLTKKNKYAYNKEFWSQVSKISNVYLLNDDYYQDSKIFIMGYFQKQNYFADLENLDLLYDDLQKRKKLYKNMPKNLPKIGMLHSPEYYNDNRIVSLLKDYDLLLSGHYHEGCMPVILDDIFKGNRGIISPYKKLFPKNARGISKITDNTYMLISGGIVKLQDCSPKLLHPLNHLCYQQMDIITLQNNPQENLESYQKRLYLNKK